MMPDADLGHWYMLVSPSNFLLSILPIHYSAAWVTRDVNTFSVPPAMLPLLCHPHLLRLSTPNIVSTDLVVFLSLSPFSLSYQINI